MTLGTLLTLPSLALQTTAKALRLLAFANEVLADRLATPPAGSSPDADALPPRRPAPAPAPPSAATTAAPAAEAPATAARDIPTLATLPAADVIRALDDLSMTELGDLFEHESNQRRRRTVLRAIEAALAPPEAAVSDDDPAVDDVRVPDELVYSTATPSR